jgi:hypothetical protein
MRIAAAASVCLAFAACVATNDLSGGGADAGSEAGTPDAGDAASTDGASNDALVDSGADTRTDAGTHCSPTTLWSAPIAVSGISSMADERGIALTPQENFAIFSRSDDGGDNAFMYAASRPTKNDPFTVTGSLGGLTPGDTVTSVGMTDDARILFFHVGTAFPLRIFVSERASTNDQFTTSSALAAINAMGSAADPFPTSTALWMTLETGAGTFDLYRAPRSGTGVGTPSLVAELSSATDTDVGPVVTDDELTIYFASTRSPTLGNFDVWTAHRSDASQAFGAPTPVPELNSAGAEVPKWLSPDGCAIYLAGPHTGGTGQGDIWVSRRSPD